MYRFHKHELSANFQYRVIPLPKVASGQWVSHQMARQLEAMIIVSGLLWVIGCLYLAKVEILEMASFIRCLGACYVWGRNAGNGVG